MTRRSFHQAALGAATLVGLVLVTAGCTSRASDVEQAGSTVTLKKAKVVDINDFLAAQKGKIVVLDCWHYLCDPCKAEFHNLVKLNKEYDGKVVCVSVSAGLSPEKFYDKSLKFLQKQEASFTNFMIDEDEAEGLQKQLNFTAVPAVFVFDADRKRAAEYRDAFWYEDGKKIKEIEDNKTYEHVNKVVKKLMKKDSK